MTSNPLKLISLILIAAQLNGCGFATTYVYNIGARSRSGSQKLKMQDSMVFEPYNKINIEIFESAFTVNHSKFGIAYSEKDEGVLVGYVELDLKGETFLTRQCERRAQQVSYPLNGQLQIFEGKVDKDNLDVCSVVLQRNERKWYGYPAQTLMAVSIPIDVAIFAGFVAFSYVSLPFVLTYHYINGDFKSN